MPLMHKFFRSAFPCLPIHIDAIIEAVFCQNLAHRCNGAVVEDAHFGDNLRLSEEMKLDLKRRGAIFEDSLGERSGVQEPSLTFDT